MAVPPGKAPIIESVAAAVRLWREALPRIWRTAVLAGALFGLAQIGAARLGGESVIAALMLVLMGAIGSFVYATFLHRPLDIAADMQRRMGDGLRVFSAMTTVGFFLGLVFLVGTMAASMMLGAVLEPYAAQFDAAKGDPAATWAAVTQFTLEHPSLIAFLALLFAAAWLALTSRLYLAAPATVADQRVRTFETWSWTKDNMLRICAARLLLLVPAWIVVSLIEAAIGAAFGIRPFDPFGGARLLERAPALSFVYLAAAQTLTYLIYVGPEAALSSYLYKGMKPVGRQ